MKSNTSPDQVRELAYGCGWNAAASGGSPEEDWRRAEEMLGDEHRAAVQESALEQVTGRSERHVAHEKLDHAVEESFPASDPPAAHLNDEPPVNAGDKWEAANKARRGRRG